MTNVIKNPEKITFESVAEVFVIPMGNGICTFMTNFLENSLPV